ncbi:hypothetical protein ACFFX0_24240 [Citricoccus parietis]|uniref:Uncharacterized protein n=1 Tax=Citricoccus parietis TaxID=592307 RepID=A0ABV5G5F4_9MICC
MFGAPAGTDGVKDECEPDHTRCDARWRAEDGTGPTVRPSWNGASERRWTTWIPCGPSSSRSRPTMPSWPRRSKPSAPRSPGTRRSPPNPSRTPSAATAP